MSAIALILISSLTQAFQMNVYPHAWASLLGDRDLQNPLNETFMMELYKRVCCHLSHCRFDFKLFKTIRVEPNINSLLPCKSHFTVL